MRLLLLGCTGLIGRELVPMLRQAGHQLTLVSRQQRPEPAVAWLQLDPADPLSWEDQALLQALSQAEGVVNLAGEPIAEKRWTPAHRRILEASRLETTRLLVEAIQASVTPPHVLVNASAIGYYGTSATQRFVESSPSGDDFLASLCRRWEQAALAVPDGTRAVTVRIGIVVAPDGGALGKMLPVFRAGFGGPIGSGRQWMSWIPRSDLCALILRALCWNWSCQQASASVAFLLCSRRSGGFPPLPISAWRPCWRRTMFPNSRLCRCWRTSNCRQRRDRSM